MTFKPPAKPKRNNETWVKVTTREKLVSALKEVQAPRPELVTFKSCLRCDRAPVAAYFTTDFIQLAYMEADNSMEFYKIDAAVIESGGGGDGGGDG